MSKRNERELAKAAEAGLQVQGWAEVEGNVVQGWARDPLGAQPATLFLTVDGAVAARLDCDRRVSKPGLPPASAPLVSASPCRRRWRTTAPTGYRCDSQADRRCRSALHPAPWCRSGRCKSPGVTRSRASWTGWWAWRSTAGSSAATSRLAVAQAARRSRSSARAAASARPSRTCSVRTLQWRWAATAARPTAASSSFSRRRCAMAASTRCASVRR